MHGGLTQHRQTTHPIGANRVAFMRQAWILVSLNAHPVNSGVRWIPVTSISDTRLFAEGGIEEYDGPRNSTEST